MTTLASVPASAATIRPVPRRQLAWVAWRRNRATVYGLGALLAALGTYLVVTGLQVHAAYDDLGSCVPPITTDACRVRWDAFINGYGQRGLTGPLLVLLPGIVGAVVGAPLVGRELESGVFRYSWTQGVGRMRWAVAVILPIAVLTAALMGALGLLVAWRNGPMLEAGAAQRLDALDVPDDRRRGDRLDPARAERRGARRTALAAGRSGGGLHLRGLVRPRLPGLRARPHLMTPLTSMGEPPTGSLEHRRALDQERGAGQRIRGQLGPGEVGVQMREDGFSAHVGGGSPAPTDPIIYLSEHGYIQVHTYQPDSRYWTVPVDRAELVGAGLAGSARPDVLAGTPTLDLTRPSVRPPE